MIAGRSLVFRSWAGAVPAGLLDLRAAVSGAVQVALAKKYEVFFGQKEY